jgi:membrane protease YdiL (CAAX protease family)
MAAAVRYLAVISLLANVAPLTLATRLVGIARVDAARMTMPAYVVVLGLVVLGDVLVTGGRGLAHSFAGNLVIALALGVIGIPVAWLIDRRIIAALTPRAVMRPRTAAPAPGLARVRPSDRVRWDAVLKSSPALIGAAGLIEEAVYRFYLPQLLAAVTGIVGAIVISLIVYGLIHGGFGLSQVVAKTALGILFFGLLGITGSLLAPCVAHAGFNVTATVALQRLARSDSRANRRRGQ